MKMLCIDTSGQDLVIALTEYAESTAAQNIAGGINTEKDTKENAYKGAEKDASKDSESAFEDIYLEVPASQRKHSQILLPGVEQVLARAGLNLFDIDCFCCVTGPGSFTGIRIGVTTVRAFCQITGAAAVEVNSLQYPAYNVNSARLTVRDAGNQKLYYGVYGASGAEILPPSVCEFDEFAEIAAAHPNVRIYTDTAIPSEIDSLPIIDAAQNLAACARAKVAREGTGDANKLAPLYVRVSQAEENLKKRSAQ